MGATATLSTPFIAVEPGNQAACPVVVTNTGSVVDQFAFEVVGDAAPWSAVEPAMVNLLPGESATVTIRFTPPRSADLRAGQVPFAVRVISREEPAGSVVEEGTVDVGGFAELTVELSPASAESATKARYEVVVDNPGNVALDVELRAGDREDSLDFRLDRTRFTLDAGTVAFVPLRVRPRRRFLRGPSRRHAFQVFALPAGRDAVLADGTMVQRQLLPRWLIPALIALLLLGGLLTALWFGVMRPAVQTAARAAAADQAAEVRAEAQQAQGEAGQARQEAAAARQNADRALVANGLDPADPNAPPTNTTAPPPAAAEPIDFRIPANAPVVADVRSFRQVEFTPGDGTKTLLVTDLVLQNPRGHTGTLQIRRDNDGDQTVLLEVGLSNFRDLDQHFIQPWRFLPGETVVIAVSCQNPPGAGNCTPAVSFSGRLEG